MTTVYVGAGLSWNGKLPGQEHRSGPDFRFAQPVAKGTSLSYTVAYAGGGPAPAGINALVMHDSTGNDYELGTVTGPSGFFPLTRDIGTGDNYYLADPGGATEAFVVAFSVDSSA